MQPISQTLLRSIQNEIEPAVAINSLGAIHAPGAAVQATATAPAAPGKRHVCVGISASIACAAAAQTPVNVYLRDGASGVGAIIWAGALSSIANSSAGVFLTGISLPGTIGNAMTLEFSGAGVAGAVEAVTLNYIDVQ